MKSWVFPVFYLFTSFRNKNKFDNIFFFNFFLALFFVLFTSYVLLLTDLLVQFFCFVYFFVLSFCCYSHFPGCLLCSIFFPGILGFFCLTFTFLHVAKIHCKKKFAHYISYVPYVKIHPWQHTCVYSPDISLSSKINLLKKKTKKIFEFESIYLNVLSGISNR